MWADKLSRNSGPLVAWAVADGRRANTLRTYSFTDLVHPDDLDLLLRNAVGGGRAELCLSRPDGS